MVWALHNVSPLVRRSFSRRAAIRAFMLPVALAFIAILSPSQAWSSAAPTATSLTVTSNGSDVTSVAAGRVITLTATVVSGVTPVNPGEIRFCDAAAAHCEDSALLATVQLTTAGTATYKFRPGIGSHSYQAVFIDTKSYLKSSSATLDLNVTAIAKYPTTITIASSGVVGDYTLTATVLGTGSNIRSPTGDVSFLDTTNGNAPLGTAPLGTATPGMSFTVSTPGVGASPDSSAVADFNGDGIPDLAVANSHDNTVTVLLGNGDGTFTMKSTPGVGASPDSVALADFNGDGIPDLAVANGLDNTVTVLLGNGDGTFTIKSTPGVGTGPSSIVVGDFNGDGILDLAVSNVGDNTVTVLLGNGDGTFTMKSTPGVGAFPDSVAVADFNGDGIPDLAVANGDDNTVTVLLGNGDGIFTMKSTPGVGASPDSVAVTDFNGDGIPDLAVSDSGDNTVTVLLGNGDGTFTVKSTPGVGAFPDSVAVTDFNGDGIPDLAVSNRFDNTVTVLLGNGDGTFTIKSSPSVGNFPLSVAVADFNGDGISDLATANIGDNTVTVLLSQITQTATATLKNTVVQSGQIHQVEASYLGDMNYHSSTSSTVPLLAAKIVPALELNSNRNPSPFYGDQITLTATLNPYSLGSFVTDGEIVTFYNSGTIIGTGMLSSGVATLNISSLPIGTDKLTAVYAGDNSFTAVTSNTLAQQVNDEPFPGFVVNVNTDTTTGVASNCTRADSSNCSLRDALAAAAAAGAGNITFDPAVFGTPQTIILAASLNVASNTTITGIASGSVPNVINLVTVSGNNQFTVFTILSGAVNVAISYLNISGGTPQNLSNDGVLTLNGCSVSGAIFHGISNGGMLAVLNSTISGNVAYSQEFPQMSGGGIVNAGTAKVINSTIQGNYATVFGGGIYNTGTLTLADSTVANNTIIVPYFTTEGGGAGISNQGTLVVSNSLFEYNTTAYAAYDGVPQLDDCQGSNCPVQGMNGNQVYSYLLTVSPICAGVLGDIPAGVTTDQRGVPRTTVYSTSSGNLVCVDSGAIQTHYALTFSTEPPLSVAVNSNFPAALQLSESGQAQGPGVAIAIALAAGDPGSLSVASLSTNASGIAGSSQLQISAASTGDTLVATLPINDLAASAIPLSISATSGSFNVVSSSQTITFTAPATPQTFGVSPIALLATASSGLPVTFSVVSGPARVSGSTLTITGAGAVVVAANQAGNAAYSAAPRVTQTIVVNKASSTTAITSSTLNASLTFTATVTSSTAAIPTGSVQFLNGSTVLDTSPLNSMGVATYMTSTLPAGPSTINAVYSGDQNFTGSMAVLMQQITAPAFSLKSSASHLSLIGGDTGQLTITLTPVGGYTGMTSFSCAGLPQNATCSFNPPTLTADGSNSPVTTTMTITTHGPGSGTVGLLRPQSPGTSALLASLAGLPACLAGLILLWQRRRLSPPVRRPFCAVLLIGGLAGSVAISACGGSSQPKTPPGTSTVSVMAAGSGNNSQSITITLTVTQ